MFGVGETCVCVCVIYRLLTFLSLAPHHVPSLSEQCHDNSPAKCTGGGGCRQGTSGSVLLKCFCRLHKVFPNKPPKLHVCSSAFCASCLTYEKLICQARMFLVCVYAYIKAGRWTRRLSSQTFEPLTFLCQRSIGFIFVHQQLDLLWFERRVEYLVQARVSLFIVNELRHLLRREVWTTLSPPEERGEETTSRGGGVTKRDVGTRAEFKSENMRKWKLKGEMLKGRRRRRRSGN